MTTPDKTLLVLGIVFFAVLVVALLTFLAKGKSITPLLPFFILPIGMIGFSEIKDWKGPWGEIDMNGISSIASEPNDKNNIAQVNQTIAQLEKVRAANPGTPVPPQIQTNLVATVNTWRKRPGLTPESHLALARAELFLGDTNNAAASVNLAVKANTNLLREVVDPRLRILVHPISH